MARAKTLLVAHLDRRPRVGFRLHYEPSAVAVTDEVPAFVRFEGPLYMGPAWRIDLAAPKWP